jgi:Transglycosylase SLT domain
VSSETVAAGPGRNRPGVGLLAPVAILALLGAAITLSAITALWGASLARGGGEEAVSGGGGPSALARREIPTPFLALYEQAATRYGLDWAVLAGIGKVECDHGQDTDPSCSRPGAVNAAGAGGPMQFIASTWARYGVDGDGDGRVDRWDSADAIFAAANYLSSSGAPRDYDRAILAYNHAGWYVTEVQRWAARYRGSAPATGEGMQPPAGTIAAAGADLPDAQLQAETSTPVRLIGGERATLAPGDGHVALVPAAAPGVVQAMVVAGNELQQLRYGPGGHPDPRDAPEEDCSSTVSYVLYRSGVRPIEEILRQNPLAQAYVRWGAPGPGRWVTIYSTTSPTDHTFMTIAGLRLDTSHNGTDVGPNRGEDGPRWRVLDQIPTWARWSVRHPPGL